MIVEQTLHPAHPHPRVILQERLYLFLAAIFIASLVSCNLIFQKFFTLDLLGIEFILSVGLLPYPVTFLVTDVLCEIYGKKRSDQVVMAGFVASIFMLLVVAVAMAAPAWEHSPVDDPTFNRVFGLSAPAVFSSMMAYLFAQFVDIRLFHFWKRLTKGKHLWLRNNGSTILSQLVDTMSVISLLCLFGVLPWVMWTGLVWKGWLFKVLIALADTPFFYLATFYLRGLFELGPNEELEPSPDHF